MATALGLDFGTTNSVLALAQGASTRSVVVESMAGKSDTTRTALSFLKGSGLKDSGPAATKIEAGQAAIREFIDFRANAASCNRSRPLPQALFSRARSSLRSGMISKT